MSTNIVTHPKIRKISKKLRCSKLEAIGMVVALWAWGIDNATEKGDLIAADVPDLEEIYTGLSKLSEEQIVETLFDAGWLDREEGEISIHDWNNYQKPWYRFKHKREREREAYYENKWKKVEEGQLSLDDEEFPDEEPPPEPPPPPVPPKPKTPKEVTYTKEFEELWNEYPYKRGNKEKAFRSYKAKINEGYTHEELLAAVINYASVCQKRGTSEGYIMHGSTFLGEDHRFKDYLPKEEYRKPVVENKNPFAEYLED